MTGLCECGCGRKTRLAPWANTARGHVKGQPMRFVAGHAHRAPLDSYYTVDSDTGCWVWTHTLCRGYGVFHREGVRWLAHRFFYARANGLVPDTLDHLCRNKACVNPAHLEPCSRGENVRRGDVAKLSWEKVAEIRAAHARFGCSARETGRRLAAQYGVSMHTIRQAVAGSRWGA